jgi:hypothetical protein
MRRNAALIIPVRSLVTYSDGSRPPLGSTALSCDESGAARREIRRGTARHCAWAPDARMDSQGSQLRERTILNTTVRIADSTAHMHLLYTPRAVYA